MVTLDQKKKKFDVCYREKEIPGRVIERWGEREAKIGSVNGARVLRSYQRWVMFTGVKNHQPLYSNTTQVN